MTKFHILAMACALFVGGACDKKSEEKKGLPPASDWKTPPSSPAAGDPAAAQAGNPHGATAPGGAEAALGQSNPHGGMDMNQNPHAGANQAGQGGQAGVDVTAMGLKPPDPGRAIDPNKYLKGTIKVTDKTKDAVPAGAVIFVSVKRADASGQPTGAPLAVKRLRLSTWPVWFQLTEEDAMVSGTDFAGDVVITAWADQDQDAISKTPGDVLGTAKAKIPSKDIVVNLDTVLK